jgi:predicted acylesterase/phospholipase RssA
MQDLPRCPWGYSFIFAEGHDPGGRRVVNSSSQASPVEARSGSSAIFPNLVRFALAPLILVFSGFFTANFLISGQYTWPQTTRTLALILTVVILSYEFVYKEQLSRGEPPALAWSALLYSCALPYVIGALVMTALWVL